MVFGFAILHQFRTLATAGDPKQLSFQQSSGHLQFPSGSSNLCPVSLTGSCTLALLEINTSVQEKPISQCRYNYTTTFINFVAFISFIQDVQESLRSHLTCHLPSVASSCYCTICCTFPSSDLGNVPGVYASGVSISNIFCLYLSLSILQFWYFFVSGFSQEHIQDKSHSSARFLCSGLAVQYTSAPHSCHSLMDSSDPIPRTGR